MNFAVFGVPADCAIARFISGGTRDKLQNDVLETPLPFAANLSLKEMAVIKTIQENPQISISAIATRNGLSNRPVDSAIAYLKEKAILSRIGAKNNETWIINISQSES